MSYSQDPESKRWFIKQELLKGESTNWFATDKEAHCYERGYNCDGTDCPFGGQCNCCESC